MPSTAFPACRVKNSLYPRVHTALRRVCGPVTNQGVHKRTVCRASDVTQSFLDLTSLVAPATSSRGAFEDLAYAVGREAYADLNGWHLFLKDMTAYPGGPKMHNLVAEQLGTKVLANGGLKESDVEEFLKKVPVKLGQGKITVSLQDVLPPMCVQDIVRACEDFERNA